MTDSAGKLRWASLLLIVGVLHNLHASTLQVPAQYASISDAIMASTADDTILVDRGVYAEQLRFPLHRISVMSYYVLTGDTSDILETIVDGSPYSDLDTATIALFSPGTADSAGLWGFTLTGGHGIRDSTTNLRYAGAVSVDSCNPIISHCLITGNTADIAPAASLTHSAAILRENRIYGNTFGQSAVKVGYNLYSDPILLEGNYFGPNPASEEAEYVCILVMSGARAIIRFNVFDGFTGRSVVAIMYAGLDATIVGNTFINVHAMGYHSSVVNVLASNDVILSDNMFEDIITEHDATVQILSTGQVPLHMAIEGNLFENVLGSDVFQEGTVACLHTQAMEGTISNNIFRNNRGRNGGGVFLVSMGYTSPPILIERNLVEACSARVSMRGTGGFVARGYSGDIVAHFNIFRHNYPEVVRDDGLPISGSADFTLNYWGHPSGPYHPIFNPDGLGDPVGDSVLFDPWLTDSNIAHSPTPLAPLPDKFVLECYPNPFNPETRLKLTVSEAKRYKLVLHDLMGRAVREVFDGAVVSERVVTLSAGDLPSGIYFIRVSESITHRPVATAKLVLLK